MITLNQYEGLDPEGRAWVSRAVQKRAGLELDKDYVMTAEALTTLQPGDVPEEHLPR